MLNEQNPDSVEKTSVATEQDVTPLTEAEQAALKELYKVDDFDPAAELAEIQAAGGPEFNSVVQPQETLTKDYNVEVPLNSKGESEKVIASLTETLERDEKILAMIQQIKSSISTNGAPEIGSAGFNDIVDSLRYAGHDYQTESLAKKLISGEMILDTTIEDGYRREIKSRQESILKNQQLL